MSTRTTSLVLLATGGLVAAAAPAVDAATPASSPPASDPAASSPPASSPPASDPAATPALPKLATLGSGLGSGSAIGPDGALYVTDGNAGSVLRIDTGTGDVTTVADGLTP